MKTRILICLSFLSLLAPYERAAAVTETFDGFANGTPITNTGGGSVWTIGTGYTVIDSGGVAGSKGLGPSSMILNWKGQPFVWSTLATGTKLTMSLDFQTSPTGQFDDDRVGWTITPDAATSTGSQLALQLDNRDDGGMVLYHNNTRTPVLNALSGIKNSTWYRFSVEFTKLGATNAAIVGTLTELNSSGNPTGTPYVGTITNTGTFANPPSSALFSPGSGATFLCPSFKNHNGNGVAGNADNATFTITLPAAVTETFDSYANGTALTAIGGGGVWTIGTGYTVIDGGGVAGSKGVGSSSTIFNWKARSFVWSALDVGTKVTMSLDFQSSPTGQFDDDRVGWTITPDASTSTGSQLALQLDNRDEEGMSFYHNLTRTPVLNSLSGIKNSTWYRFSVGFTKLGATNAAIVGTLTELDASGNPTGTPYVGTIADTGTFANPPSSTLFSPGSGATFMCPSFKNHSGNSVAGDVDNATLTFTAGFPPSVSITNPAPGAVFYEGTNVTIRATAADSDGSVSNVAFFVDSTRIGTVSAPPYTFVWTNATFGTHSLGAVATDNQGLTSTQATVSVNVTLPAGVGGLLLDGVNDFVTFGAATSLGVSNFTVECWFRRLGSGVTTTSGTGGITAVPLVTKGRGEAENSNVDCDFFLGINSGNNVLAADFEDFNGGVNHPVTGVTPVSNGVWQHAAMTYDSASGTWVLYLNGVPDATSVIAGTGNVRLPRWDSIQHAGLGTAMTSTGVAAGFLCGVLDEVRIWNYARSQQQIEDGFGVQISNAPGLIGRWSLDDASGVTATNTGSALVNGTLVNGPLWVQGFDFSHPPHVNHAPLAPVLTAPAAGVTNVSTTAMLSATLTDPDSDPLTVTFYARPKVAAPGPDFTVVALPDTQMYTAQINGGSISMFTSQADWIVNNRVASNIVYVTGEGDISNEGDQAGYEYEWQNATNALYRLGDPGRTGLADGIPFGVVVGNHDLLGGGALTWFTKYVGTNYFQGRSYYGGHYGTDNANHYDLFSAGGVDFIALSLKMGAGSDSGIMAWANSVLQTYANRRAIVTTHSLLNPAVWPTPGAWTAEGPAIFNALSNNPNLFLMMCGHMHGVGRRHEAVGSRYIDLLLADWQDGVGGANGGNGYLRMLRFSPASNQIHVSSYSPYANQNLTDGDSQFDLALPAGFWGNPWTVVGVVSNVPSGTSASINWTNLACSTQYEWYAVASDGQRIASSATSSFVTLPPNHAPVAGSLTMGTTRDHANTVSADKLLEACRDPDGDALSIVGAASTSALGGRVALTNSIVTYTPPAGVSGTDNFTYTVADTWGLTAQGTVTVTITAPAGSGPNILGLSVTGSSTTVRMAGIPEAVYQIQASSDLATWANIGSATAGANGLFQFIDPDAGSYPQRFYRAVQAPPP